MLVGNPKVTRHHVKSKNYKAAKNIICDKKKINFRSGENYVQNIQRSKSCSIVMQYDMIAN